MQAMLGHQPAHGGAIALVILLLDAERLVLRHLEERGDIAADPLIDLLPEIEVMRIERVVEIEHPGLDLLKSTRCGAAFRWNSELFLAPDGGRRLAADINGDEPGGNQGARGAVLMIA